jgi:hypothetical protein
MNGMRALARLSGCDNGSGRPKDLTPTKTEDGGKEGRKTEDRRRISLQVRFLSWEGKVLNGMRALARSICWDIGTDRHEGLTPTKTE